MRFHKIGFPEEDEIVLCTVKNVQYHSVFASMDHYGGKTGMIHISEVSPGRIRNIRDFVVEGKKICCKVLRVNHDKGHIDLSLRRVNESQRRMMNDRIKQEQRAEKIIDSFAEQAKLDKDKSYKMIAEPIFAEHEFVHEAFNEVVEEDISLEKYGLSKEHVKLLEKLVKEKITPKVYEIGGMLMLKTFDENGLDLIKTLLKAVQELDNSLTIKYRGGGSYSINMTTTDAKEAEKILKKAVDMCEEKMEEVKGQFEFHRKE